MGACFHALCLASALESGDVPEPSTWVDVVQRLSVVNKVIREDHDLSTFWLSVWEQRTKNKLEDAFQQVQSELKDDLMIVSDVLKQREQNAYQGIVKSLGAFDSKSRGSATKTAILSSVLSWMFRTEPIPVALVEAVNVLGSDTDTIATMTGAIMGAVSNSEPEGDLLDRQYIKGEAIRLFEIGNGDRQQKSFKYPDLMNWRPPKTMMDAVGYAHESVAVLGLGSGHSIGDKWESRGKDSCVWQWLKLSFGQTILAKQRNNLPQFSDQTHPPNRDVGREKPMPTKQRNSMEEQVELFDRTRVRREQDIPNRGLDELTNEAIRSGFNPEVIGKHILELAERPNAIELGLAYVAVIVKAKRARIQAQAKSSLRVAD